MKTKLFETYPQTKRFTEVGSLKRIKVVIQDTKKVIRMITGLESMIFMFLWKNMKQNQFALVFDEESDLMLGYISKNQNGIPQKYMEMENLTFKDMYEVA